MPNQTGLLHNTKVHTYRVGGNGVINAYLVLRIQLPMNAYVIVHETVRLYNFILNMHHFGARLYNVWSCSTFTKILILLKFVGKYSQQYGKVLQAFRLSYYQSTVDIGYSDIWI